jgi:hypothetical protein
MTNNIPCLRNKTPTLLVLSAAAIALMLTSPMLFFNVLLQPVQAQTTMTFRTPEPADGEISCCPEDEPATLTFDAQGTASSSDPQTANITGGTIQLETPNIGNIYNGKIVEGTFTNDSRKGPLFSFTAIFQSFGVTVQSRCSTYEFNAFTVIFSQGASSFNGPVECSSSQGGGDTAQPSSMAAGSSQDSDGDGIPDSSDRCTHNSNHRCYKEGDNTSNTTQRQPSSSSSNSTGNQTR